MPGPKTFSCWAFPGPNRHLPAAGTNGLILGEILGRSAGDIVADEVPCRFLLARPPLRFSTFPGLANVSCDVPRANALLGVLAALILTDFAERVGVLSLEVE